MASPFFAEVDHRQPHMKLNMKCWLFCQGFGFEIAQAAVASFLLYFINESYI